MTLQEAINLISDEYGHPHPAIKRNITEAMCKVLTAARSLLKPAHENSVRVRIAVAVGDGEGDLVLLDPEDDPQRIIAEIIENFSGGVIATAFIEADLPRIPTVQARVVEAKS